MRCGRGGTGGQTIQYTAKQLLDRSVCLHPSRWCCHCSAIPHSLLEITLFLEQIETEMPLLNAFLLPPGMLTLLRLALLLSGIIMFVLGVALIKSLLADTPAGRNSLSLSPQPVPHTSLLGLLRAGSCYLKPASISPSPLKLVFSLKR